jgi:hypothetical protein
MVTITPCGLSRRRINGKDGAKDHSVFSKNRDRLLEGDIAARFLAAVLAQPKVNKLCRAITSRSMAR